MTYEEVIVALRMAAKNCPTCGEKLVTMYDLYVGIVSLCRGHWAFYVLRDISSGSWSVAAEYLAGNTGLRKGLGHAGTHRRG